ncbi:MAG TPA: HYR domain-containing protein, partial [Saprospiraceae bacterium]|nr:HYR domain-containing protein [Saprospiraceae bacterium]
YNTGTQTIEFCPGETVTIGGIDYTQSGTVIDTIPGTAGCDTIVTYSLILLPYNTTAQTIQFCPGESVTIDGVAYTQSGTVVDTIPGTVGCDTIVTYTLILLSQPTRSETIEFCSGESVTIGGIVYTQPGTVIDTIPASVGCDTIATYTLKFIDTPNSSVSIDCPDDIDVAIDPGDGPVAVNYNLPAVSSDCECPGIALVLTQGLPSGSLFPVGSTKVCYSAKDSCGNTATCCFTVFVREESACDIKTIGCLKWELLDITKDAENDLTYRIRVTNNCANKLIYTAIQIPDGLVAVAPANNSVYAAPSGRQYDVRNPNYSPFYSIRFKSQTDSIANGQSDIFKYKLPGQTLPAYIHVNARLAPQIFYEAHLNTFNCPVGVTPNDNRPADKRQNSGNLSAFKVFPNPTSGALYADFSDWQGEQLQVQVYSSQGQR